MTAARWRILQSAMERVLPSEGGPGAKEANAIGYVEWLVRQEVFRSAQPCLVTGLDLLESEARAEWGRGFAECQPTGQDTILQRVQDTPHPAAQRFFVMLVKITITGYLCPPHYGGNRGGTGWQAIGFESHPHTEGAYG